MNYYPYYMMTPTISQTPGITNLLGRSGISFKSILNGTQRVLRLANQALPLIKEAAPMMRNAKTMFKVMNEFKKIDAPKKEKSTSSNVTDYNQTKTSKNGPTFFA